MKYLIGLSMCILLACQSEEKKPSYLWEREKFVEVLTDFQVTEAVIRLGYHRFPDSVFHSDSIYAAMYEELNVSEAEFDSNYHYHMNDPEAMAEIYEEVLTNLSERSAGAAGSVDQDSLR